MTCFPDSGQAMDTWKLLEIGVRMAHIYLSRRWSTPAAVALDMFFATVSIDRIEPAKDLDPNAPRPWIVHIMSI